MKLKIDGDELETLWCLIGDAHDNAHNDRMTMNTFNYNNRKQIKRLWKKINRMMYD